MNKDEKNSFIAGLSIGIGTAFLFFTFFGDFDFVWHRDAVKHNAAHYDGQTGAFTWNQ
jgi:hypothetical protein